MNFPFSLTSCTHQFLCVSLSVTLNYSFQLYNRFASSDDTKADSNEGESAQISEISAGDKARRIRGRHPDAEWIAF